MKRKRLAIAVAALCVLAMTLSIIGVAGCGDKKPGLSSMSPDTGSAGTEVTLEGSNFGATQGDGSVEFGTVTAEATDWSDNRINFSVPSGLDAGDYNVTVMTSGGTSNSLEFALEGKSTGDNRKSGQVEHNTPLEAIQEYCRKNGIDTTGWSFSVVIVSKSDPGWKIDEGVKAGSGETPMQFLLHKVNEEWTVVAGSDSGWTAEQLQQEYKAPGDLADSTQIPAGQVSAIQTYLESESQPVSGWTFTLVKQSREDTNWDVVMGKMDTREEEFVLIWNNMAGAYQVVASSIDPGGPPWTGVEFKGETVPSDIVNE